MNSIEFRRNYKTQLKQKKQEKKMMGNEVKIPVVQEKVVLSCVAQGKEEGWRACEELWVISK